MQPVTIPRVQVFTSGCFDVLHAGHGEFFQYMQSLCRRLDVGHFTVLLCTDFRVKELKGGTRPVNTYREREAVLFAVGMCSVVELQGVPFKFLEAKVQQSGDLIVYVKGNDYVNQDIPESKIPGILYVTAPAGDFAGIHTTDLLDRIKS